MIVLIMLASTSWTLVEDWIGNWGSQ